MPHLHLHAARLLPVASCVAPCSSGEAHVDAATVLQELRGADDHAMINSYFDAIEDLVALVREGHADQAKQEGLCQTVLDLQEVCAGHQDATRAPACLPACLC